MERLTMRNDTTKKAFLIDVDDDDIQDAIQKLAYYEEKQEQGLLIELPCKVGDTVYLINHFMVESRKKPIKCNVDEFTIDGLGCYAVLNGSEAFYAMQRFRAVNIKEFGKTVFLTRSEAESALQRWEVSDGRV